MPDTCFCFVVVVFYYEELTNQSSSKRHSCASVHALTCCPFMSQRFKVHVQTRLQRVAENVRQVCSKVIRVIWFHHLKHGSTKATVLTWELFQGIQLQTVVIRFWCIFTAGSQEMWEKLCNIQLHAFIWMFPSLIKYYLNANKGR